MDDLDRLHRRLVHNVRMTHPEYLRIPFTVRELYEQLVPYRHNRRELAIETNDDYETAVARLLSGERGYIDTDPTLQDSLKRELASPTGDPGVFKEHGDARVTLAPVEEALRTPVPGIAPVAADASTAESSADGPSVDRAEAAQTSVTGTAGTAGTPNTSAPTGQVPVATSEPTPRESVTAAYDMMAPTTSIPSASSAHSHVPSILSSLSQIEVPTGCRFCGGSLPEGRDANFCPHCGENLRTKRCPACGSEMDTAWNFCVTCGRRSS